MNYVDLLLLAGMALYVLVAMRRGAPALLMDLAVLVLSFLVALRFYGFTGGLLARLLDMPSTFALPAAFLGVLVVAQVGLGAAASRLLHLLPQEMHWSPPSMLLATVPAAAHAALIAAAILLLLLGLPVSPALKADVERSAIGGRFVDQAVVVERLLAGIFGDAVRETLTFLTVEPEASERITLRVRPERLTVHAEAERRMLELVNAERAVRGIDPLVMDETIVTVARAHSADMWARQYFAHVNPEGETPFDRMREGGVEFGAAGENLALAATLEQAHRGLMNSPGHRRNILDPAFGRIGIGVVDGGPYGLMFTQNFAD